MKQQHDAHPLRAAALLALGTTLSWGLRERTHALRHPVDPTFDALLTAAACWVLLAALGWTVLVCAAAVVETATSGRLGATAWVCPSPARRLLLPVLGLALAGGVATPTWAATGPATPSLGTGTGQAALPTPDRPVERSRAVTVVGPGDTLWDLTAERLGPGATDAEVARAVARNHHLNRAVVGPDPDLIRPGQRLLLPRRAAEPTPSSPRPPTEEKP